jgi:hypothetical protein
VTSSTDRQADRPFNEAEETVEAIHRGNVDAVVVQGPEGPQVMMLQGADAPYHILGRAQFCLAVRRRRADAKRRRQRQ